MKRIIIGLAFACILVNCSDDDYEFISCSIPEASDLFDELWMTFDHEYAAFEISGIDWDEIRTIYRPQVNANTTEEELFGVFKSMLFTLKDAHSDLYTYSDLGSIQYYYEVTDAAPNNYIGWTDLNHKYLENITEINAKLAYGKVKSTNIGYLRIETFSGQISDFNLIDRLLNEFENLEGIIIDVRNNDGGSETNGYEIAGRLTNNNVKYRYGKLKDGCDRNRLSDFIELHYNPVGSERFLGKVVLLTNKKTFSAGEDFTLMMKALPNVTHIGDDTWGGFATGPSRKTLSNGWQFRFSKKINYDLNRKPFIGGIAPDEKIMISQNEENNDIDRIIERAIEIIN